MTDDGKPPKPGFESAFALSIGCAFFLANFLLAGLCAAVGYCDEYLQFSIVLLGASCMIVIEKLKLGGIGATILSLICVVTVLINLFFVGFGDM